MFTDDEELADRLRSLRVHGKGRDKYDNVNVGLNGRLDTIQAAILLEKLSIFEEEITQRRAVANRYSALLEKLVTTPKVRAGCASVWAQYTVTADDRDALAYALKQQGVPSAVYYPAPMHRQTAYRGCPCAPDLSVSERLCEIVLSLPMHPYLEQGVQNRICEVIGQGL